MNGNNNRMNFEANLKESICGFLHKCTQSAKQDFHFCQTLLTLCLEFPTVLKLKVVDFPTARTPVSLYNVSFNKKAKREVIELTRLQNKKKSTLWILLCKKKKKPTRVLSQLRNGSTARSQPRLDKGLWRNTFSLCSTCLRRSPTVS